MMLSERSFRLVYWSIQTVTLTMAIVNLALTTLSIYGGNYYQIVLNLGVAAGLAWIFVRNRTNWVRYESNRKAIARQFEVWAAGVRLRHPMQLRHEQIAEQDVIFVRRTNCDAEGQLEICYERGICPDCGEWLLDRETMTCRSEGCGSRFVRTNGKWSRL